MENKFQPPAVQKVSETDLDHYTRQYLQTLVDNNLVVSEINFVSRSDKSLWEGETKCCFAVVFLLLMRIILFLFIESGNYWWSGEDLSELRHPLLTAWRHQPGVHVCN